jgi:hypothetical protein
MLLEIQMHNLNSTVKSVGHQSGVQPGKLFVVGEQAVMMGVPLVGYDVDMLKWNELS